MAETSIENRNMPMIVDISIANDGRQIYSVHQNSEPQSSTESTFIGSDDDDTSILSSKRSFEDSANTEFTHLRMETQSPNKMLKFDTSNSNKIAENDESEVWGQDVENAFEEALKIIPKNGLSKIKVSGRSCGRNELISDFILQKTGKMRTRKQVSSHIQVIKNLKKNQSIIDLINNGPSDPDSLKKFEEVFSKITFQKSIGDNSGVPAGNGMMGYPVVGSNNAYHLMNINKRNKKRFAYNLKNICEVLLNEFSMKFNDTKLSTLKSKEFDTTLKLKSNANINSRFPGLFDLVLNNAIPSLHGMCKIFLPESFDEVKEKKYNTSLGLQLKGLSVNESSWSVLTVVYSFGEEVVRLTDLAEVESQQVTNGVKNVNLKIKFAPEFWDAFFISLQKTGSMQVDDEKNKDVAIRAITMKQIVFKNIYGADSTQGPTNILKKDIRSIVLWEFLRVDEAMKALTTIRKIHLVAQQPALQQQTVSSVASSVVSSVVPSPQQQAFMSHQVHAPVPTNPIMMPHVNHNMPQPAISPLNSQQFPQFSPYTPASTPPVSVSSTPMSHIMNIQQQEDLIARLDSPLDLINNGEWNNASNFEHTNNVYQYNNNSYTNSEFDFMVQNNGSANNLVHSEEPQNNLLNMGFNLNELEESLQPNVLDSSSTAESNVSFNSEFSHASNGTDSTSMYQQAAMNFEDINGLVNSMDFGNVYYKPNAAQQQQQSGEELIW